MRLLYILLWTVREGSRAAASPWWTLLCHECTMQVVVQMEIGSYVRQESGGKLKMWVLQKTAGMTLSMHKCLDCK